jgi:cephalosporin-C deacetylase-like acetyl esterase
MKATILALLWVIFLFPQSILAQRLTENPLEHWHTLNAAQREPPSDPFLAWMDGFAQQQLQKREDAIAAIHTVAEAERRKQYVRAKLLELMGGFPNSAGPLNARITGEIAAQGYTIEKLLFESLPDFYVTANVYRPNSPGRYPAILVQAGHTQEGKPEDQRLAANLALKGFVVLAFDPIGQGEREQTYAPQLDGELAGWNTNEHLQAGAQSMLLDEGLARYFIWDAKRALDYLESRADVDASRLGAVGCSGGGALTTFIGAFDGRLKAVAPACFTQTYRLLFAGMDPDPEMTFPHLLVSGLDHADFAEMAAPTPWLFLATEHDYFTPPGAEMVYQEAQRFYRIYGAEDKVRFFVGHGPHGMPLETREVVYEWMTRFLKDGQGDTHEQPVHLYSNLDLLVTKTGHVVDIPGSRKLYQLILDDYRAKHRPGTTAELLAMLERLGIPSAGPAPEVKVIDESTVPGGKVQRIRFETEPGLEIGGKLYIPNSEGRKPAVLLVAGSSTGALAQKLSSSGRVVLEIEPRDSPSANDHRPFIGDWWTNERADWIGRNLVAMRAHDIVRGVDILAARRDVDPTSIRAAAEGVKGIWLLLAAAADSRIRKVWLDRTPYNLQSALERSMNTYLFEAALPGFVLHWDLENLVTAMGSRTVLWTDPTNWMGQVINAGPTFKYRYVLGDTTDFASAQEDEYIKEFTE